MATATNDQLKPQEPTSTERATHFHSLCVYLEVFHANLHIRCLCPKNWDGTISKSLGNNSI